MRRRGPVDSDALSERRQRCSDREVIEEDACAVRPPQVRRLRDLAEGDKNGKFVPAILGEFDRRFRLPGHSTTLRTIAYLCQLRLHPPPGRSSAAYSRSSQHPLPSL
jgi:hypothetical protein